MVEMENGVVVAGDGVGGLGEWNNGEREEFVEARTGETPRLISDNLKESGGIEDVFVEAEDSTPRSEFVERALSCEGNAETVDSSSDGNEVRKTCDDAQVDVDVEESGLEDDEVTSDLVVGKKPSEDDLILENGEKPSLDNTGEVNSSLNDGDESTSDMGEDPKKMENGATERVSHDVGENAVTAPLIEPSGGQDINEVNGGSLGSNVGIDSYVNGLQQNGVDQSGGVVSNGQEAGDFKEPENASNADHLNSPDEGPVDVPTGSDVVLNETDLPSMLAKDEDSEKEDEGIAAQETSVSSPLVERSEKAESEKLHQIGDSGDIGSTARSCNDSEPPKETSTDESVVGGKGTNIMDKDGEFNQATPQSAVDVPAESSSVTNKELTDGNVETSGPAERDIHPVTCDPSSELERKEDQVLEVNQPGLPNTDNGIPANEASTNISVPDIPAHPVELTHSTPGLTEPFKQESALGNTREQVRPATVIGVSPPPKGPAVTAPAPAPLKTNHDMPVTHSSTIGESEVPAHPVGLAHSTLGAREQESTPGNTREQVRPAIAALPTSIRPSTAAPSPPQPAGLGRAAPLPEPASRHAQQPRVNGTATSVQNYLVENPTNGEAEETDETREKLQMIRVKFLRLAYRLGQTPHNVVVAQVLYRLGLAEQLRGRSGGRAAGFSFDRASSMAEQLEASGQDLLDFSCTIMVLGKSGVGKSATINSIFDEVKFGTDAFQSGTKKVQDVVGTVQGIKVRVIDTPGLLPSLSDQRKNEKILLSVRQFIKKTPPDIILYLDRLDMPNRELGDMPLLKTITEIFGPSIWFNAIVVLTHAASAPPEGPNGATSYDMFVTQRSHVVQQAIRMAAGDMRLMNPVSLVENHSACRTNRAGQRVLPNGQVWKPHLLLLSFASKILAEANTLLKLQDSPPGKPFAPRSRAQSLPFLLSTLLQSRTPVKLPSEQYTDDDDGLDADLDESSDSEDESEYDELPPFKRLTKLQLAKLPRAQRKAYHDELEYRERLFMKKQLKEEKKRRKMMKKMQAAAGDLVPEYQENVEEESSGESSVPVPMPDLALPASFDSDNPTHRYRCLDSSNQWFVRPVLDPNSWDHDVGYEGINVERLFALKEKIPISFSGQLSKDKKDAHLQMEISSTVKHGEGKSTSLGFDMHSAERDMVYTLRSETRFNKWRRNKALAGISVTLVGDTLTGGVKVEDKVIINKQGQLVVSAGAVAGRAGDVAYGGSLEATIRDKDHPLGRFLSTLGLSVMDWHGDFAVGCNLQSQIPVGRSSNLFGRASVNNRGNGSVSIRFNSTEHLQIVLLAAVPLVQKLVSHFQSVESSG